MSCLMLRPWRFLLFTFSILVIALDLVTKNLAIQHLSFNETVDIIPGLRFRLLYNRGAAFSLLDQAGGWQRYFFIAIAVGICLWLLTWFYRLETHQKWTAFSITLILGGAIANVIDRIHVGYVTDFIELYIYHWSWPVFNIADMAVCVGAVLLLIDNWKDKPKK